jgi:hypothetical protein
MTFKQKTVIRILLLVARMLSDEPWTAEIDELCTHILHGDHALGSERKPS